MPPPPVVLLPIRDVAARLGVTSERVSALIRSGELAALRLGPRTSPRSVRSGGTWITYPCPYCDAAPGEWCVNRWGGLAEGPHLGRRRLDDPTLRRLGR